MSSCYFTFLTTSTRPTIFYFHGFPASRLEGASWSATARSLSARLIATDRPGCGLSTFQPNRRILDWPSDVLELADNLRIPQFHVLGASGGCPYVLACARAIPRSRLLGAAVVSGIYPLKLGAGGMLVASRVLLFVASWATSLVAPLLE
jgi:pimeloyl-ACP methyl ester carboxylesterase